MDRKKRIQNPALKSFSRRNQGKNTQRPIYPGKSFAEDKSKSGSDFKNFFKNQFGSGKNANVTYRAYEIIPRNSPYSHHFKTLLNAESFTAKKEYQMAVDIYQRLLNKIPIRSSREKIEQNISDIEKFLVDYEEPFSPKIQVDLSLSGAPQPPMEMPGQRPPGMGQMAPPSGGGPIQIQMTTMPSPMMMPGAPGVPGGGPGGFGAPGGQPGQMQPVMAPFGFVQAQAQAEKELKEQQAKAGQMPFGFFDKIQEPGAEAEPYKRASEDIIPANNTEKLLKELTDGIFQIEKAIFDTTKMTVQAEQKPEMEAPEKPAPTPSEEAAKAPIPPETAEEEKPGEEAPEEEAEMPEAPEAPEAKPAEAPTEEEAEGITGKAVPEEEEELGEGILEKTGEIGSLEEGEMEAAEEEEEEQKPAIQEIRGVLELKEPEPEDTPFITITYDFNKIPHHFFLSKDHNILEYAYYKYKPMLVKAQRFIRKKQITKALNYYRVIRDQQIPEALRQMVDKNIQDISEYLEKYLMTRPG